MQCYKLILAQFQYLESIKFRFLFYYSSGLSFFFACDSLFILWQFLNYSNCEITVKNYCNVIHYINCIFFFKRKLTFVLERYILPFCVNIYIYIYILNSIQS